jgi:gamma-glutamylcyclotransferase (GGCT)/AIG2-like uncharacterized protein YtfP
MADLLFVYGTLRKTVPNSVFSSVLEPLGVQFLGMAKMRGVLRDFGPFPGLVRTIANKWAFGEVYRLYNPEEAFARLDAYEGFNFQRRAANVRFIGAGPVLQAWAYEWVGSFSGSEIPCGNWAGAKALGK